MSRFDRPTGGSLHTCKYRECDNRFIVAHGNGGQQYCSPLCRSKEVAARNTDRKNRRIATAQERHEENQRNPLPGSTKYGKRAITD